jgi:YfiH family protein
MFLSGKTRWQVSVISPVIRPDWPIPPGVIALSTLRQGGSSQAPYDSWNLAHHVGDDSHAVAANRARLGQFLPAGTAVQWLNQVHGTRVIAGNAKGDCPDADACWTREHGVACAVLTADCLPVLFCSAAGDAVAAAHAGWRGLLAGVLENTVSAMGVQPGQLLAWLGPAISGPAFEVGQEVRAAYLEASSGALSSALESCFTPNIDKPGHYFADLYALTRLRLAALGVGQVYGGNFCTYTDPARFFSYRRDGQTGRMASLILCNSG